MASTSWRCYHYSEWSGSNAKVIQSKFYFSTLFFPLPLVMGTQINALQRKNFAVKFSFVTNSNKKALSMPCHFQFRRKCTNKLLPLGHLWQQAILCQLLLKTIHITAPKISLKITVFFIHVTGCQFWKCKWETGPVTIVNSQHYFNTRTADPQSVHFSS